MLGKILGYLFNFIYDQLASMGAEPANFSFLAMTNYLDYYREIIGFALANFFY